MSLARRGRGLVGIGVAAVVAAGIFGYVAFRSNSDEPLSNSRQGIEGERAPAFSLPGVRDEASTVALSDFEGTPVVLNFWAWWCVPCRKEMPAFQRVHESLGDDVAFVGIDHEDGRQSAIELLDETGVTYPSGFDPQGTVAPKYGLFGMPGTVLISDDGTVLDIHVGELTERELRARITKHFGIE